MCEHTNKFSKGAEIQKHLKTLEDTGKGNQQLQRRENIGSKLKDNFQHKIGNNKSVTLT